MKLEFTKTSALWVAEFIASSDFNLHIEGVKVRDLEVYQRGVGDGKYFIVTDAKENLSYASEVYDMDFAALVYPKHIKVVCRTEPSLAEITTDGEVTEIKAQSKEIEVTSNGTIEVAPDAGFAYLSNVKVKTNVPTSGEGGASSWRYFDVSMELPNKPLLIAYFGMLAKKDNQITTGASLVIAGEEACSQAKAIAVDLSKNITSPKTGDTISLENFMSTTGIAFVEITEEEFYNLD